MRRPTRNRGSFTRSEDDSCYLYCRNITIEKFTFGYCINQKGILSATEKKISKLLAQIESFLKHLKRHKAQLFRFNFSNCC